MLVWLRKCRITNSFQRNQQEIRNDPEVSYKHIIPKMDQDEVGRPSSQRERFEVTGVERSMEKVSERIRNKSTESTSTWQCHLQTVLTQIREAVIYNQINPFGSEA